MVLGTVWFWHENLKLVVRMDEGIAAVTRHFEILDFVQEGINHLEREVYIRYRVTGALHICQPLSRRPGEFVDCVISRMQCLRICSCFDGPPPSRLCFSPAEDWHLSLVLDNHSSRQRQSVTLT